MRTESKPASPNLRTTTERSSALSAGQSDTRRFASIFPVDVPEADFSDSMCREYDDAAGLSRWQLVAVPDDNAFTSQAQVASAADEDEGPSPSSAQQVTSRYRAVHRGDHTLECPWTEINEKLSQIPDDGRSMYTIVTSIDPQSTMDMMWKPKPKVHMRLADQIALMQAEHQAVTMVYDAGLEPTDKIQCRRRGCADILPGVEALKYHIHIHNIADMAANCEDISHFPPCESAMIQHTSSSKFLRSHPHSKFPHGIRHRSVMSKKLLASSLFPMHLYPCENTPDTQPVPSFATVAKTLVSDHDDSPNKPINLVSVCDYNDETSHVTASIPFHSPRGRKESFFGSIRAGSSSIATMLSPPSSPNMRDRFVFTPHTNFATPNVPNPIMDSENEYCSVTPNEGTGKVFEWFTRSQSPIRALSPTRAMSPIRSGIKRVLSIGYSVDSNE